MRDNYKFLVLIGILAAGMLVQKSGLLDLIATLLFLAGFSLLGIVIRKTFFNGRKQAL